eukprot:TRINITY_DN60298_c0_g1_i1.p1 TRINITY_DN60298_c0_g1~~TRINITY_DN60298_c0_g1_i1.p1  ORF type:complete len:542 (+),score=183.72 TRINITY_DN60298_c0_g1_i1:103-1626(+)
MSDDEDIYDDDDQYASGSGGGYDSYDDAQLDVALEGHHSSGADDRGVVLHRREQQVWTTEALLAMQQGMVDEIVELLSVSPATARVLLRHYHWNKDSLRERYFEDSDGVLQQLGLAPGKGDGLAFGERGALSCSICLDNGRDCVALSQCMHFFCIPCFAQYLASSIAERGMSSLSTTCPQVGCNALCDLSVFERVLGQAPLPPPFEGQNQELVRRYRQFEARSFVEHNGQVRWCPAADCGRAVHIPGFVATGTPGNRPHIVTCDCGSEFCFLCSAENHTPASCKQLSLWLRKERDEGETSNWMAVHTKPCPKCHATIEKSGGCNHMNCWKCRHDFCWVCEEPWEKHGNSWYQCNFYDESKDSGKPARDEARKELERYIHYYTRYRNHDNSKRFEKKILRGARERMRKLQEKSHESLDRVEYLEEAAIELLRSRHTLKYTYVYAFFLTEGSAKTLFEYNQAALEHSTEQLSELLESEVEPERQAVVNQLVLVRQSLQRLQTGCYSEES